MFAFIKLIEWHINKQGSKYVALRSHSLVLPQYCAFFSAENRHIFRHISHIYFWEFESNNVEALVCLKASLHPLYMIM